MALNLQPVPLGNHGWTLESGQQQPQQQQASTVPDSAAYPLNDYGVKSSGVWGEFSKKHPNLALALELGIFYKAVEEFKQEFGDILERHNGIFEAVRDHKEEYLPPKKEYFVTISNGTFFVGDESLHHEETCHKLYLSGTNKYEFVEAGAGAPFLYDGQMVQRGLTGPEVVRRTMHDATKEGLNFIRSNAFAVDSE